MLGKYFNKPVVITARGTDINLIPQYRLPRKMILWAAQRRRRHHHRLQCAQGRDGASWACAADKITPLRNGVDLQRFPAGRPRRRARRAGPDAASPCCRSAMLDPRKGHDLTIEALPQLPDVHLLIAGIGPERAELEALARDWAWRTAYASSARCRKPN